MSLHAGISTIMHAGKDASRCLQKNTASEEVVMHLIKVKYLPVLLYGTDACPTNTTDLRSLEYSLLNMS